MATAEHPLPAQLNPGAARKAEGFATPKQDKRPQCARFLPKRVLPVIFLPGIMGSNLRMSAERQKELRQKDNIAWRPDSLGATNIRKNAKSLPRERQLRLDPLQTTVDIYDPSGPSDISGDERHDNVELEKSFLSPLLTDDPVAKTNGRTAVQKSRARGWGEVFFGSYGELLQHLETRLNNIFSGGGLRREWRDVVGVDPRIWGADPSLPQQVLTEDELKKAVTGCWFAVYAFGYNWLQSNGDSAQIIATRINKVIDDLNQSGYECKQVIVVTHSMGGLVGRALVHPDYGNLQEKVLGIVHGVMPAIGAPAAYKRMRAGFEDPGLMHGPQDSLGAKVAGNYGDEVTAVLANAPGGLQLLPSESYGNGWLRVTHNGRDVETWPKNGDPYTEIYKLRGKWYGLFREEWINPSGQPPKLGGGTFERTCNYLDKAQKFHETIANTYHSNSYAHYGTDPERRSFREVVWEISKNCADTAAWRDWPVVSDNKQGKLELVRWNWEHPDKAFPPRVGAAVPNSIYATLLAPTAPGDQTVPAESADHQLKSGMFKGVFRQLCYEHQSSYKDPRAIASTLYSIVRIAQKAAWNC
ncbi:esterase/lipase family protein [Massilia norwichensis]|uniref:GPI inositol-deacylase n=1 Tax=Massilia norwichensis TaxID=1442366 RepID=A0ABT2A550_9BURK|nr:GPI inositol-deacylase [Massilia norwichensis]MCS0589321.1 GPI inositol-deacylase [Massilia norwichensis]